MKRPDIDDYEDSIAGERKWDADMADYAVHLERRLKEIQSIINEILGEDK